ncbi:MAG: GntR family transcriptional regulator, partial [Lentisphaeria bacterium]|nr:GntR family transcriptional regulator [Lentisphaeria bacterium]
MLNSPYQLKRDARNPLYQQIASNLRLQITSGQISQGDFLAPEKELSQEMGVNHITLRKALMVLEGEGLITRKRKVGTVVLAPSFWKLDVAISKIGILVWNEAELSEDASSFCRQITSQEMTPVILRGDQDDLREQIRENGIHGLIIFPTAKAANIRLIDSIKMPKLLLQYVTRVEGMDNLVIDSFPGVYGGVKQLLNFGHRDF